MQFDFGKNWIEFANKALTPARIEAARADFISLFQGIPLQGKSFLDIGFGQGLSLLFAAEQGAHAYGNDINPKCAEALARTKSLLGNANKVPVVIGSVLVDSIVGRLRGASGGAGFDIVHSWGVLHHTGNMRRAFRNTAALVKPEGHLVIAIYNRHWSSPLWRAIKWGYCKAPSWIKKAMIGAFVPIIALAKFAVTGSNPLRQERGMDFYYNVIDWVGGYPYEYASCSELVRMVENLGFRCIRQVDAKVPTGCNEFVFRKRQAFP